MTVTAEPTETATVVMEPTATATVVVTESAEPTEPPAPACGGPTFPCSSVWVPTDEQTSWLTVVAAASGLLVLCSLAGLIGSWRR